MDIDSAKDFASLLHAYALGCLEREDFDRMMEYFKSNQDYPWQELGEYQNLVSLLPSFLNIEVPDVQVKDRVARKLYRLRDQQRPQRATQIIPPGSPVQHKNLFQRIETPEQKLFSQISSPPENEFVEPAAPESFEPIIPEIKKIDEFEPVSSAPGDYSFKSEVEPIDDNDYSSPFKSEESTKEEDPFSSYKSLSSETSDSEFASNFDNIESGKKENFEDKEEYSFESSLSNYSVSRESSPKTDEAFASFATETIVEEPEAASENKEAAVPQVEKKKSGVSSGLFFFLILILAGAIGGVYYYLSKDFKTITEQQAAKYEKIVKSLQTDLVSTKEVDELLASINLQMVTLKSTPKAGGAYGKFLFDSVTRKAMVHVVNLPVLSSDKAYQLWVISNNQKFAAGVYTVTASHQYFQVTTFSGFNLAGATTFLITEELAAGGEKPSKDVYLAGQFVF